MKYYTARTMFNAANAADRGTKDVWITNDPEKYKPGGEG